MKKHVSEILSAIFCQNEQPPDVPQRTVSEMLYEVERSTNQLNWLVKRWSSGGLNHARFEECVDLEQSLYQGFSPRLWREDPCLARITLVRHDEAMRYVLVAKKAIDKLRTMGYEVDALPEAKRRYLAKFYGLRLPQGCPSPNEEHQDQPRGRN